MKLLNVLAGAVAGVVLLLGAASSGERRAAGVIDRAGQTIKTFTENSDAVSAPAATSGAAPLAARQAADCAQTTSANPLVTTRTSLHDGATVDPCGRFDAPPRVGPLSATAAAAGSITIDRMTTRGSYYGTTYTPGGTLLLLGSADTYTLSNGSTWQSGAGSYYSYTTALDHVEVSAGGIRYVLFPPPYGGDVYQQTDYDSGDHSAQGTLAAVGPLVIEATAGSTTAVMKGNLLVVANDATYYGEPRFNYYGALVGSVVPFELTYTLQGGATWQADTFTHSFSYLNPGSVDFTRPVTTPEVVALTIGGPAEVPDETVVQYSATARYANGVTTPVAATSSWRVEPTTLANIDGGLLTLGKLSTPRETLTLSASYVDGGVTVSATKTVICVPRGSVQTDAWPMYQANAQHTGYLPLSLSPEQAHLLWQRDLGSTHALNPVAAAEGRVFATVQVYFDDIPTLFALDAQTGGTIWSKSFGSVFSVNPPSTAYGSVYVQTGDHATDTWLWAFDAATGAQVFKTPHAAQWERYYAPTIYDGKVLRRRRLLWRHVRVRRILGPSGVVRDASPVRPVDTGHQRRPCACLRRRILARALHGRPPHGPAGLGDRGFQLRMERLEHEPRTRGRWRRGRLRHPRRAPGLLRRLARGHPVGASSAASWGRSARPAASCTPSTAPGSSSSTRRPATTCGPGRRPTERSRVPSWSPIPT